MNLIDNPCFKQRYYFNAVKANLVMTSYYPLIYIQWKTKIMANTNIRILMNREFLMYLTLVHQALSLC